jgi:hypothetical protein
MFVESRTAARGSMEVSGFVAITDAQMETSVRYGNEIHHRHTFMLRIK